MERERLPLVSGQEGERGARRGEKVTGCESWQRGVWRWLEVYGRMEEMDERCMSKRPRILIWYEREGWKDNYDMWRSILKGVDEWQKRGRREGWWGKKWMEMGVMRARGNWCRQLRCKEPKSTANGATFQIFPLHFHSLCKPVFLFPPQSPNFILHSFPPLIFLMK